ncbi:excise [Gordonia phage Rabbitrun]|uniref:Excise n=1 Tax=Gordonia phage Rabbitrun TaxID=2762280 RepID=A0A7G8LIL6_9CAUD|nr:excise [Gordonia phage Rabbitrun]QNJ57088.1 excise [Gordonia phage Rabbitrun]
MTVRYLTTEQVAEATGFTPKTIREKAVQHVRTNGRKGLRGFQTGPNTPWRFRPRDVEAFIEGS